MGVLEINSNPSRCFDGGAVLEALRAALMDPTFVLWLDMIYSFGGIIVSLLEDASICSMQMVGGSIVNCVEKKFMINIEIFVRVAQVRKILTSAHTWKRAKGATIVLSKSENQSRKYCHLLVQ